MAHGVSDSVRRHYNYAQHLPERRIMMQAWADYLDGLRSANDEQTSTVLFSRFASAHAVAEQTGVGAPLPSDPEISVASEAQGVGNPHRYKPVSDGVLSTI